VVEPIKPTGVENTPQEQFSIRYIYVKGSSFETTSNFALYNSGTRPSVETEMSTKASSVGDDMYEVVLTITATVKIEDKTAFIIEANQAGMFGLKGFDNERMPYMLYGFCPNILFPYIRELISDMVTRGGFQPLILAPVNFDALYARQREQLQAEQQQANKPTN
jgi:preprotein translocase subunit SecB